MRYIASWCVLILIVLSTPAYSYEPLSKDFTLYNGASYRYMQNGSFYSIYLHDIYEGRSNLFLINNGDVVYRSECYKNDICYLGNTKLRVNTVFYGREFIAIKLDVLKIYGNNVTKMYRE